jgi:hypothetical protein
MSEVRDLTIRGPIDRAVEAVIIDGRLEVSVACLGFIPAFQFASPEQGHQLAIAITNAVHDAEKAEAIANYSHPAPSTQGFADELEPSF